MHHITSGTDCSYGEDGGTCQHTIQDNSQTQYRMHSGEPTLKLTECSVVKDVKLGVTSYTIRASVGPGLSYDY